MTGQIRVLVALLALMGASATSAENQAPYTSIGAINLIPQTGNSSVTVRATLTLNGSPSYIQDPTGGAALEGPLGQGLRIGDELLIDGRPENTERGLVFPQSRVALLWHGSPVPPLSVTADEAALGKFVALLIDVSGRLVDVERSNGETWLRLESGHQVFLAHLNSQGNSSLLPQLDKDSVLRLRGICSLQPRDTQYQGGFAVLLRSAEDVTVVSGPPWWSLKHLAEFGFLLVSLAFAAHLALIQTLKARFHAIMNERARFGQELHDTLAQSFTGLSYQIQAARKNAPESEVRLTQHLDLALDMVRHSHAEAHRSIMMLRPHPMAESADLQSAIQTSLEQITAGCNLDVHFTTRGSATPLPLLMTDALFRIAQEAIANALRHGRPTRLEIILDYLQSSVCLSVIDNGAGFDVKALQSHGFGLAGMKERVRALRGSFSIESEPGEGTRLKAEVFLRQNAGMRLWSVLRIWASSFMERAKIIFQGRKAGGL